MIGDSPKTTVYVNNHHFEFVPGESLEIPVVFPWWVLLPLTLTLKVSVVDDRVVRLDTGRSLRRRSPRDWRVTRLAKESA